MSADSLDNSRLEALREYDTPTVCNVIELFDVRPRNVGYFDHRITAAFPQMPPMVGYALTSTFRSFAAPREGDAYESLTRQTELMAERDAPSVVVFQDLDDPTASATFGEVMCSTYQAFGAAGLITSGTGRDLDQVEEIGFPVFTGGTTCAHGYCHILSVDIPVTVGGVCVTPGTLVHGDRNGVTTIPHEIASEVPEACAELIAAEQIILDYVRSGSPTPSGFAEARKVSGAAIAELARRLQGK